MSILRNLSRNLWNAIEIKGATAPEVGSKTLNAVRQQRVPGVLGLGRFRDGFDTLPQGVAVRTAVPAAMFRPAFTPTLHRRDGFDSVRRAPVDLSGGMKSAQAQAAKAKAEKAPNFAATINELAGLLAA